MQLHYIEVQYGIPIFSAASILDIMPAIIANISKFLGDSNACARVIGYPAPPVHALNRGKLLMVANNRPKPFIRTCLQETSIYVNLHNGPTTFVCQKHLYKTVATIE